MLLFSGSAFLLLNIPYNILIVIYKYQLNKKLEINPLYRLDRLDFLQFQAIINLLYTIYTFLCSPLNYSINFYLYVLSHGFRQELYGTFACLNKYQINREIFTQSIDAQINGKSKTIQHSTK